MKIRETPLQGAFIIEPELKTDERGYFARTWCEYEFELIGLKVRWVQSNISGNTRRGTLRGLHYQVAPHEEAKLVRCTAGRLYDVIIDLRRESQTYLQYYGVELSARSRTAIYIPEGFAHGFETLEDETEVLYLMSAFYAPESARGVRWNDPLFSIQWPTQPQYIADRDQQYPDYNA